MVDFPFCVTDFLAGCLFTEYKAVVNSQIHDVKKDFLVERLLGRRPAAGLHGTPSITLLYSSTTWGMSTGSLSFPFFSRVCQVGSIMGGRQHARGLLVLPC